MQRRITDEGLLSIEVTRVLNSQFGIPMVRSIELSRDALDSRTGPTARLSTHPGVSLELNLALIEERLRERLLEAVESVAPLTRGRPRKAGA